MLKPLRHILTAAFALGVVVPAMAQTSDVSPEVIFKQLDSNEDGTVAADEVDESQKRFFERALRRGDANDDGKLTKDEFVAGVKDDDRPSEPPSRGGDARRGRGAQQGGDPGQTFDRLDRNSDGKISKDEVPEQFRQRLAPLFERLGKDEVTREEFTSAVRSMSGRGGPQSGRGNPDQFFNQFDSDKNGKLSLEELPAPIRPRMQPLFDRLGKDEITREELAQAIQRGGSSRGFAGAPQGGSRSREAAAAFFDRLDENGDGTLEPDEVSDRGRRAFEEMARRMGKSADKSITKDEYLAAIQRMGGDARRGPDPRSRDGRMRPDQSGGRFFGAPAVFRVLDQNSDGRISKDELAQATDKLASLDENGDGSIDMRELFGRPQGLQGSGQARMDRPRPDAANARPRRPESDSSDAANPRNANRAGRGNADSSELAKRLFDRFDTNNDDALSEDEAPERLKERFDQLDANGDGKITATEFSEGLSKAGGRRGR